MKILTPEENITRLILTYGNDILTSEHMQSEKSFIQHNIISCFEHSVSVAYMSVWLACQLKANIDIRSLIRGALLHDYFLYDWHLPDHQLHGFSHARKALENAERDFNLNEIEEDIIIKHMFPLNIKFPKYKESVIVTLADKICASCEILSVCSFIPTVEAVENGL